MSELDKIFNLLYQDLTVEKPNGELAVNLELVHKLVTEAKLSVKRLLEGALPEKRLKGMEDELENMRQHRDWVNIAKVESYNEAIDDCRKGINDLYR